ncbi:flagellar assembly peptidoglycan hydrolase FlgJ, partial [Vibrio parahaemolyticus]
IEKRLIESGELSHTSHTPAKFDSPESFVNSMKPYAEKAAKALGVEPSLLLAQAALETGWGQKVVQNARGSSNNLFNIKADRSWQGDKVTTQTLEFHDNTPVKETAAFRSYSNYQDSFNDYVRFLNDNPRYETALQQRGDSESFIRGIHRAGYATDPTYADKVLQVKQKIESM